MGKYVILKSGIVTNLVVATSTFANSKGWVSAIVVTWKGGQLVTSEAKIGDQYINGSFVTPEEN